MCDLRRAVALVVIALTATGCSKAVEIPLDRIGEPEWRKTADYRFRLVDGDEYFIRRFSVVDSTVVVEEAKDVDTELMGNPNLAPRSIPIDELRSVEKIESRKKVLALYFGIIGAMFGALALVSPEETVD